MICACLCQQIDGLNPVKALALRDTFMDFEIVSLAGN